MKEPLFFVINKLPKFSQTVFISDVEIAYAPVVGIFIKKKLEGKPMTIFGDGKQTRDSVSVIDVVRANILASESDKVGVGEVINIGSGRSYSVNELAKMVGGPIDKKSPHVEVKRSLADFIG